MQGEKKKACVYYMQHIDTLCTSWPAVSIWNPSSAKKFAHLRRKVTHGWPCYWKEENSLQQPQNLDTEVKNLSLQPSKALSPINCYISQLNRTGSFSLALYENCKKMKRISIHCNDVHKHLSLLSTSWHKI